MLLSFAGKLVAVTWLCLVALEAMSPWTPCDPGSMVTRTVALKSVSTSVCHRVILCAMGRKTRRRLVLTILVGLKDWILWLCILDQS